jgi:hypothetical protein
MRDIPPALQRIDEVALNHLEASAVTARCMSHCMVKQFYFCSSMRIGQPIGCAAWPIVKARLPPQKKHQQKNQKNRPLTKSASQGCSSEIGPPPPKKRKKK